MSDGECVWGWGISLWALWWSRTYATARMTKSRTTARAATRLEFGPLGTWVSTGGGAFVRLIQIWMRRVVGVLSVAGCGWIYFGSDGGFAGGSWVMCESVSGCDPGACRREKASVRLPQVAQRQGKSPARE